MPSELFRLYPARTVRATSVGLQPVPYHVYDGQAALFGGWVDGRAAHDLLNRQGARPVLDRQGRALAGIWACEFTQAGIGPHCELHLSLAAVPESAPPESGKQKRENPFELLRLILLEPELRLFSAALWNDTRRAVVYKREILGLDARPCLANFSRGEAGGFVSFRFEDEAGGLICQGDFAPPSAQPLWDGLLLNQALRREGLHRLEMQAWQSAQVTAPGRVLYEQASDAQTFLQARSIVAVRFSRSDARLNFGASFPTGLDFQPAFLETFTGLEFVYLPPYNHGEEWHE